MTIAPNEPALTRTRGNVWGLRLLGIVLVLWAVIPEVRRFADWQIGYSALPVINLIPLVALAPLIFFLRRGARPTPLGFSVVVWSWLIGFGFAFAVGIVSGGLLSVLYESAQFLLPLLAGIVVVRSWRDVSDFSVVANVLAVVGAGVGLYGVYQYFNPPPWDVFWVLNARLGSLGLPVPFGLRIFSTLNSPGVLADFLAAAILTQLPYLRPGRGLVFRCLALVPIIAALGLTFVRASWLAVGLGAFVYFLLSPRRASALGVAALVGALTCAVVALAPSIPAAAPIIDSVQTRIQTFQNLQSDDSYLARERATKSALDQSITEPLGQGLGNLGTSTKLANSGQTTVLDNGYLSRLLEMGFPGFLAYLCAVLVALCMSMSAWIAASKRQDVESASIIAVCIAIQMALIGLEASSDHHNGLNGVLFWITLAVPTLLPQVALGGAFGPRATRTVSSVPT